MKICFQDICREGYCWDDKLNVEMKLNWDSIIANIRKVDEIHIQRCYAINEVDDPFIVQLIGFSDASQLAYGCCIYFKFIYSSGKVKVRRGKEKLSNVTSKLGGGGGGDEYVKICDGGVTGGGRGSNFGDFLRDVIKVWPLIVKPQIIPQI